MRLHEPGGYFAFLIPHVTGTLLGASQAPCAPSPRTPAKIAVSHVAANLFLRGSACSYNDTLDGLFDRPVERCRHRSVASAAVSEFDAHIFAAALAAIWVAILASYPLETGLGLGLISYVQRPKVQDRLLPFFFIYL